jgi:hypothetical protein
LRSAILRDCCANEHLLKGIAGGGHGGQHSQLVLEKNHRRASTLSQTQDAG